ncbi:MAG: hypothetical protein J2P26_09785, partial [Nocardiopsaceae bacterium]|nr:hypothetical protein [Nocardiopsaceae bacterium]
VDPCSIVDPAALNRFGHTQLSEDQGNFDRCDVIVSPPGGDNIDVELQFLTGAEVPDPPPRATTTAAGHIRIVRMPEDDGRCMRYLLLPDGYAVVVDPKTNGNLNLCPMANAAVPPAVAELRKGTLPRRSLPASSLARRDTCALLDSAALTRAVNAVGDRHQAGFGNWTCRWSSLTSDLSVMLRYDQGDPGSENDGQPEKLSGRDAYVSPGGDGNDGCLVRIVNRTFTDSGGSPAEEVVYLVVNGNRPPTELCAPANTLAANAAANLQRR